MSADNTNIREVAVLLIHIQTVAYHKLVADGKSDIVSFERHNAAFVLIQKRADL